MQPCWLLTQRELLARVAPCLLMVELFTITNRARFLLLSIGLNNEVLGVTLVLGSNLADNGEGEDPQIPDSTVVPGTWRSGFKAMSKQ